MSEDGHPEFKVRRLLAQMMRVPNGPMTEPTGAVDIGTPMARIPEEELIKFSDLCGTQIEIKDR